jgi:hypothetical protein
MNGGLDAGAPPAAHARRIVMLTAEGPPASVSRILDELRAREIDYELVSGANVELAYIVSALERYGEDALYVICRDGVLDDGVAAQMRDHLLDTQLIPPRNLMVLKVRPGKWGYQTTALQQRARTLAPPRPPRKGDTLPEVREFLLPASSAPPVDQAGGLAERLEPPPEKVNFTPPTKNRASALFLSGTLAALAVGLAASFAGFTVDDARDWFEHQLGGDEVASVARASDPTPVAERPRMVEVDPPAPLLEPASERIEIDANVEAPPAVPAEVEEPVGDTSEAKPEVETVSQNGTGAEVAPTEVESPGALQHALDARDVRELHYYMVDAKPSRELDFASAQEHCRQRTLGGLDDWRLAQIGELSSLVDARTVRKGLYWSATPADAEANKYLLYEGKKKRVVTRFAAWKRARAVCVRERDTPS